MARLRARNIIVATFFCKRDDADRRNPRKIIPTLANQLAVALPGYRQHLADALSINFKKNILQPADPAKQLSLMLTGPLKAADVENRRIVLFIDALDECDEQPCHLLVDALVGGTDLPKHVVIVLVSRRLRELQARMNTATLLADLDQGLASPDMADDIYRLLQDRLKKIAKVYEDHDWPKPRDISALTARAGGLFIWATIACNFINQPSYQEVLEQLLSQEDVAVGIDELYTHALDLEFAKQHGKTAWVEDYKSIMGVVLCSVTPLSANAISALLQKRPNTVKGMLAILQPVLLWGSPVRLAHASLADYLLSERSGKLYVQPKYQHLALAEKCLQVLCSSQVHFNMAGISDSSVCISNFPDIQGRRDALPDHINYSARNWATHLKVSGDLDGAEKQAMMALITRFLKNSFLFWLETISLIGKVYEGVDSMNALCIWLQVCHSA